MRKPFFLLIAIGIFQATNGQIAGLASYYPFTTNAGDSSGAALHGTLYGGATVSGGMLSIGDNDIDYMALPADMLNGAQQFTIAFRIRFNAFHITGVSPSNHVLSGDLSPFTEAAFALSYQKSQNTWKLTLNGITYYFFQDPPMYLNTWYCVVLTRDAANQLHLYVDGEEAITSDTIVSDPVNIDTIVVGQDIDCYAGCFTQNQSMNGDIDALHFYNVALSCLTQNSTCATPFTFEEANLYDDLLAYYKFNGDATDASGNNFNAALNGGATANDTLSIGNNALDFVGIPGAVFDELADFSINFRVKFNEFQTTGTAPTNHIFSCDRIGEPNIFGLSFEKSSNAWLLAAEGLEYQFVDTALQENEWHCIKLVRDIFGKVHLYKDGTAFPETYQLGMVLNVDTVVLGQETDCFAGCFTENQSLNGLVDEFKVYSNDLPCFDLCEELILSVGEVNVNTEINLNCYPNPFSDRTTITYTLASSQNVKLKLYDATGREIKTLVSKKQNAGRQSVEINASDLPSGVFICKLFSGNAVSSCKLAVMR